MSVFLDIWSFLTSALFTFPWPHEFIAGCVFLFVVSFIVFLFSWRVPF